MKTRPQLALVITLSGSLVVLGLAGPASAGGQQAAKAAAKTVTIHLRKLAVGKVLTGSSGRTVYRFEKDTRNTSHCGKASGCRSVWPPVMSKKKPAAGTGVSARHLKRTASGQVTYYGHPLYYYVGDHRAGVDHGENLTEFGAKWFVIGAKGAAIKPKHKSGGGTTNPPPPYVPPAPTGAAGVSTGTVNETTVLTDLATGRTLYELSSENPSGPTFYCTGDCQKTWIPLLTDGAPTTSGSAMSGLVSTVVRADDNNEVQVTYNNHPLYLYVGDTTTGTDNGNGIYDPPGYWYALNTSGTALI